MNRDTICVQGGYTPGNGEPRQIPIIQSTTFKYATSEDMGKLFDLEADGYFRYQTNIMIVCVILLVLLVQIFQTVGTFWATRSDKRLRK